MAERFERDEALAEQEREGLALAEDADEFDQHVCDRLPMDGDVGRTRFLRHWVAELRLEFPARQNRPSDRAAMAKWLTTRLREKGMRVRHIADMVPRAVAFALNPSRAEVHAAEEAREAQIRSVGGRLLFRATRWLGFRATPPSPGC